MLFEPPAPSPASSYRVSARAYRPQSFQELIGQDLLVAALTQALTTGRLPHAFLLTGIRGVGKTTTARILARCLNCATGPTITPCGTCDSCRAVQEDRHLDVIEIDAASHTGVDDIRELLEAGRYRAVTGRYKVYIIDEAHMLSKSAFNALLKTLEEPPPHLIFILATTELEKVPATILSRCMRCELKRIPPAVLVKHLITVAEKEGSTLSEEAGSLLARAAEGSARDALSLLDHALTISQHAISAETVREMLGLMDKASILDLFETVTQEDLKATLMLTQAFHRNGANALKVAEDLLELIYTLTVIKAGKIDESELPPYAFTELTRLEAFTNNLSFSALMTAWHHLLLGITEIQNAPSPHLALDMVLVRLAKSHPSSGKAETVSSSPLTEIHEQKTPPQAFASPIAQVEVLSAVSPEATSLASLSEIVAFLQHHKEVILAQHVKRDVGFVSLKDCQLAITLLPTAAPELPRRLAMCLSQLRGENWTVSVSQAPGELSLAAQEAKIEETRVHKVKAHPLVTAAVDAFPGAMVNVELTSIATKEV